jgi:hypothetical protein
MLSWRRSRGAIKGAEMEGHIMKCPNCGYEPPEPPKPEPPPYEYTGYLKIYLPTILKLLRMGMQPFEVVETVEKLNKVSLPLASGMVAYIRKRYGIEHKPAVSQRERDLEIVRRYGDGDQISMRKLGREYGISSERVRGILLNAERRANEQERQRLAFQAAESFKDVPIEALHLPTRVRNCLRFDYTTVGDVMKLSDAELLRMPNFGRTSIAALNKCLETLQREFAEREVEA